ncbi:hypothetical protein KIN20_001028 [Parelaphostrongylus tenuis]|uniref:Uncharacterized protein n=1 Tax=Parelaphostrongylus tenuis TaxID=148309 RepID=A0AAD5MLK5_PARTN|nr:hypothetical protein KIN20_001028 [Parelaphostrongylus tenuis]
MNPPSVLKKSVKRSVDSKHVTFASSGSVAKQQLRMSKSDQRKRQTQEQIGNAKRAKHTDQFERLIKCEETLVEAEYDNKTLQEKALTHRQAVVTVLSEVGECVCKCVEMNNTLAAVEEELEKLEKVNNTLEEHSEVIDAENIVKDLQQVISKNHEFGMFLSEISDSMNETGALEIFYEALPAMERMLSELTLIKYIMSDKNPETLPEYETSEVKRGSLEGSSEAVHGETTKSPSTTASQSIQIPPLKQPERTGEALQSFSESEWEMSEVALSTQLLKSKKDKKRVTVFATPTVYREENGGNKASVRERKGKLMSAKSLLDENIRCKKI